MNAKNSTSYLPMLVILGSQWALGFVLAIFTPDNILTHPWALAWAHMTLGMFFPRMLDVPAASSAPQVVIFYHATMCGTWPLFAIPGFIYGSYFAPGISQKYAAQVDNKLRFKKSQFVASLFIAPLFLLTIWSLFYNGYVNGSIGRQMWHSRNALLIFSLFNFWVIGNLFLIALAQTPAIIDAYWGRASSRTP